MKAQQTIDTEVCTEDKRIKSLLIFGYDAGDNEMLTCTDSMNGFSKSEV